MTIQKISKLETRYEESDLILKVERAFTEFKGKIPRRLAFEVLTALSLYSSRSPEPFFDQKYIVPMLLAFSPNSKINVEYPNGGICMVMDYSNRATCLIDTTNPDSNGKSLRYVFNDIRGAYCLDVNFDGMNLEFEDYTYPN